jgi:hypothetical protein
VYTFVYDTNKKKNVEITPCVVKNQHPPFWLLLRKDQTGNVVIRVILR